MVTKLKELISVYFWWGVIFGGIMNIVVYIKTIDKVTLLLSDQFVLEGEKLFRWSIPHKKKLQTVKPLTLRLCVPRSFRHDIIKHQHDVLGHFGVTRTCQSLVNNYFWKEMYKDVKEYGFTCDTCLCSKRHYGHRTAGLNPLELSAYPWQSVHLDHNIIIIP